MLFAIGLNLDAHWPAPRTRTVALPSCSTEHLVVSGEAKHPSGFQGQLLGTMSTKFSWMILMKPVGNYLTSEIKNVKSVNYLPQTSSKLLSYP